MFGFLGEVAEHDKSLTQEVCPSPVHGRAILVLHGQNGTLLHAVLETPLQLGIFPTNYAHFQDGRSLNENYMTHDA